MRRQFKSTVMELASHDDRIVILLGDVSVYLFDEFKKNYPDRFYNLGICENTLISVGAGLASQGLHPFVHTIAPFITERSYEQIKLDLCYNQFGGNIVSCGASFDYAWDGATHHCYNDLALLRMLPGMEVIQPGSRKEVDLLLKSQYNNGKPTYFRLSDHPHNIDIPVEFGRGVAIKDVGAGVTVMTAGPILANVLEACRDLDVNLVYFHTIKPIDKEIIAKYQDSQIVVVHDAFGLHEAVSEVANLKTVVHGVPSSFCSCYGSLVEVRETLGLDPSSIRKFIDGLVNYA